MLICVKLVITQDVDANICNLEALRDFLGVAFYGWQIMLIVLGYVMLVVGNTISKVTVRYKYKIVDLSGPKDCAG